MSASGKYSRNENHFGFTIDEWVTNVHRELSVKSGWTYSPLKFGSFGYDNMVSSIGRVFHSSFDDNVDRMAALVHDGWVENYCYWRDHTPWVHHPDVYFKPYNPLGDERRNQCASQKFSELSPDEQEKDRIIARYLITTIKQYLMNKHQRDEGRQASIQQSL